MGLWLALGSMTLLAAGLAVAPLVRRVGPARGRRDYDLRVYRAQLAELARERERGVLGEPEAEAARLEVERRTLVLQGSGGDFAAGADIGQLRERRATDALAGINTRAFQRVRALQEEEEQGMLHICHRPSRLRWVSPRLSLRAYTNEHHDLPPFPVDRGADGSTSVTGPRPPAPPALPSTTRSASTTPTATTAAKACTRRRSTA